MLSQVNAHLGVGIGVTGGRTVGALAKVDDARPGQSCHQQPGDSPAPQEARPTQSP